MQDKTNKMNDTQQNILNVAEKLITEKGVKETSLSDIAREVGISKGTLYYYYSKKSDIIYDIAEIHLERMTEKILTWIADIEDDVALEKIIKVVLKKISNSKTRGKLHLYLTSQAAISDNSLKKRFKEKYKEWREKIEEGLELAAKNRNIDHEIFPYVLLAVLDGLTIQSMLDVEKAPFDKVADFLAKRSSFKEKQEGGS